MRSRSTAYAYQSLQGTLVEARRKAGLTQAELAKAIRKPQSFVSKYESGNRRLDVIEFLQIAAALKVNPSRLIGTIGK